MKTFILITLFVFSLCGAISTAHANEECLDVLDAHLYMIESSEKFFRDLDVKKQRISSYDINQMQSILENRYVGINELLNFYEDSSNECPSVLLVRAVAIYDFQLIGKSVLENKSLRRVFNSFINLKNKRMINLKKDYKVYTSKKYIKNLNKSLESSGLEIPDEIRVTHNSYWKKPKFLTFGDISAAGVTSTVSVLARTWGFIADHTKWRTGHLSKNNAAKELISKSLKPLDLIYEKSKFTLTNLTIPGHWGHVAVWLGTKEDLIEHGIWDAPFFKDFRHHIIANRNIIEVRKSGVEFISLDQFMNLDEIAISRVRNIEDTYYQITESLISQFGKKYDFKFDAHSIDRITCTEFITFSYGDIQWKQTKVLFQMNIKPDDIAHSTYGKNATSDLVIYLKGNDDGSYSSRSFAGWLKQLKVRKKNLSYGDLSRITENEMRELENMKEFSLDGEYDDYDDEEVEKDYDDESDNIFNLAPDETAMDRA